MKHYFAYSIIFVVSLLTVADAHGRRFAYVQQSNVLPKGGREFEIWNTARSERASFYRRLDTRLEFEYGLGNNIMSALYLNHEQKSFDDGLGLGLQSESAFSISSEWKWKLSDPSADNFGSALYFEGTLGTSEHELEGKIILDKYFGPFLAAGNIVLENEWKVEIANGVTSTTRETKPEITGGLVYELSPSWTIGAEARWLNLVEGGQLTHGALFLGPSAAYSSEGFWAVLTVLPQLTSTKTRTSGSLDLGEYERFQARLLFSMEF